MDDGGHKPTLPWPWPLISVDLVVQFYLGPGICARDRLV